MKEYKIYTCGKMSGIAYEKQMEWRYKIEELIKAKTNKVVTFIHPPLFYGYHITNHKSEREVKEWELNQVCDSDIVIVNIDEINSSIGSHFEMGAVCGANITSNKHITVIGFGNSEAEIHPWIDLSFLRFEESIEDAAEYIATYLLL